MKLEGSQEKRAKLQKLEGSRSNPKKRGRASHMFNLLIVEDEYLIRRGICTLLDYTSLEIAQVFEAADGQKAWEIFKREEIHIVVTDINMPKLDGLKLAALIKEDKPETHLIFLTGYNEFDYAVSALKMKADDYLLKPVSKKDIEEILTQIISKMKARQKQQKLHSALNETLSKDLGKLTGNQDLSTNLPSLALDENTQIMDKNHLLASIQKSIEENIGNKDFSLKTLAKELGFSPNYLSKRIKDELGFPFQNYLIAERIKKAKLLLLTTDLKNYEIAEAIGFEDMNYFNHRFKLETGLTPRQFKKDGMQ